MTASFADRAAWLATFLCVVGLVVTLGGSSLGAVLFLAAWLLVAAPWPEACVRLLLRAPAVWLMPVLALASVLWSRAPEVTLRAAVQLALTAAVALLVSGFLRPRAFAAAMSLSLLVGAVLSLAFGRYGVDGMTGATVFLGIFASKNTMALFMSLLAIFAAAVVLDRGQPAVLRLFGAAAFLLSVPLLLLARSAGALITTGASLAVLAAIILVARLAPRERAMAGAAAALVAVPAACTVVLLALGGTLQDTIATLVTEVLGKDLTLTGRTLLWRTALAEIDRRPLLGTGYYAFWLRGDPLVESIWREFGIGSRMGFHFHNTVIELAAELGWPGAALFAATVVLAALRVLRLSLDDATPATAALVAALACLAGRMVGEVDAPYPFAIGTFLLFVVAAYGSDHTRADRRAPFAIRAPRPHASPHG